jgi:hypothetical protein
MRCIVGLSSGFVNLNYAFWSENLTGRNNEENLEVEWRILKLKLNKDCGRLG